MRAQTHGVDLEHACLDGRELCFQMTDVLLRFALVLLELILQLQEGVLRLAASTRATLHSTILHHPATSCCKLKRQHSLLDLHTW